LWDCISEILKEPNAPGLMDTVASLTVKTPEKRILGSSK
jgi:hypothetical protein